VRIDRKEQGVDEWVSCGEGCPSPLQVRSGEGLWGGDFVPQRGLSLPRDFFNFQVIMQGFIHFIAKNYSWPETVTVGGLIDPLEAEDV